MVGFGMYLLSIAAEMLELGSMLGAVMVVVLGLALLAAAIVALDAMMRHHPNPFSPGSYMGPEPRCHASC